MSVEIPSGPTAEGVESLLREELAQGDFAIATTRPILSHLLAHADLDLFNDEVIARVRGMVTHIARQVLFAVAKYQGATARGEFAAERQAGLASDLIGNTDLLGFAHALAVEALTAERLSTRSGIDAVLSPLLQEMVASRNGDRAKLAMQSLASQARFMQQQRRMELPFAEMPEDLLVSVCSQCETLLGDEFAGIAEVIGAIMEDHEPVMARTAKFARLIENMGEDAQRALNVDHAGVSIFVSALQMAGDQSREVAVLSLSENQCARLALSLRSAGLSAAQVEEQFMFLHPDITLPDGFEKLRGDRATAALADSNAMLERVS